jgi:hypothetical protein
MISVPMDSETANGHDQNIFARISSLSSNTSVVLPGFPLQGIFDGSRSRSREFKEIIASATSSADSPADSVSVASHQTSDPQTAFAVPPYPCSSATAFDPYDAFSQQPMEYEQPMMPLAAYMQGLGEESNLFPVFAPAWLDQASVLQRP